MSFINTIDQLGDDAVFKSIIEGTITEFKDDVLTKVGEYTFYKKSNLAVVDLPEVTTVEEDAFQKCSSLSRVNLPKASSIKKDAFEDCTSLVALQIPNATNVGFRSITKTQIENLDFHNNVTFDSYSCHNCRQLEAVILRSETLCTMKALSAFWINTTPSTTVYFYVPKALIEQYKVATNWSAFANQIRAIEDYPDICG